MENFKKSYGYWDNVTDQDKIIYGNIGQCVSGYSLGILVLDVAYPLIPGNVVNAHTYDFPVRVKCIKGATTERIFRGDTSLLEDFIGAAKELQSEGVRAISGACGYFANFQKDLAENLDVPVYTSALIQAPWIKKRTKDWSYLCKRRFCYPENVRASWYHRCLLSCISRFRKYGTIRSISGL